MPHEEHATDHVLLLEVLFYLAGYALAKVGWIPLSRGLRALYSQDDSTLFSKGNSK